MWMNSGDFAHDEDLQLAGQRVTAGVYKRLGDGVTVRLEMEDVLPATLDGRVACYVRLRGIERSSKQDYPQ